MSRRIRFVLLVVVIVIIIALGWFALLNPLRADIADRESAIEAEQTKLTAAQAKLAQAEFTRQEGKKNQARLLELAKMVPESDEIPSLLLQIQDLAEQSGIDFISIMPGDAVDAVSFRILPLDLQFAGTYFDVSDFIYRAEQMVAGPGRLLSVKSVGLQFRELASSSSSSGAVSPVLGVNVTMYAFESAASTPASSTTTPGTIEPVVPEESSSAGASRVIVASGSQGAQ